MQLKNLLFAGLASLVLANESKVIDLIPKNFDSIVLTGKPALVEFFAPWCGHCKTLAPVYEELAQAFDHVQDKLSIAKVDADANRSLGKRFGVQGFPTLKWFDGKSEKPVEYNGARDLESLKKFVEEKSGVKAKKARGVLPSFVTYLTDSSFPETVGKDKDVLVAFTAPWCGHCKTLAPVWEELAADYANEDSVVIAKVDAEAGNSKALAASQGIQGYPTIKFFPKGSTEGVTYKGPRTEASFVAYINKEAGTHRSVGGNLDSNAGVLETFDAVIAKYKKGATITEVAAEAGKVAEAITDKVQRVYAEYYVKVFTKLVASKDWVSTELKRLEGMIKKGGFAQSKIDEMTRKSNVLRRFVGQPEAERKEEGKDEL